MSERQDVNELMEAASKQLDEHKAWLAAEIEKVPLAQGNMPMHIRAWLAAQAGQVKLRVVKAEGLVVTVVYDYPDELYAFLTSPDAPQHLRDSLAGGHAVDPSKPTFTAVRES